MRILTAKTINHAKKYLLRLFAFTSLAIVSCEKDDDHDDHDGHDHAAVVLEIEENLA